MSGAANGRSSREPLRQPSPSWLGHVRRAFDEVESTNLSLLQWAVEESAPHGALCIARAQRRGRGRHGRVWHSPPGGNLYFSFLLRPGAPLGRWAPFSLVCALVMVETLEGLDPGLELGVKWPNDVWIGSHKVGGVLLESRDGADPLIVAGIGLNLCAPPEGWGVLEGLATSLQEQGSQLSADRVLHALLPELEQAFDRFEIGGFESFVSRFNACSILRDRRVLIERGGRTEELLVVRVDSDGSLRVRDADGRERSLVAGEVRVRPGAPA